MRVSTLSFLAFAIVCVAFARGSAAEELAEPTHHANHLAAFVGVTHVDHADHATAGIEHEYRLSAFHGLFGAGPVVEYVYAEHSEVLAIALVHVHPWRGLNLFAGPGYARTHGHGEAVLRGGASYEVHVGSLTVAPTVDVDRIAGHNALVGGVAVGFGI